MEGVRKKFAKRRKIEIKSNALWFLSKRRFWDDGDYIIKQRDIAPTYYNDNNSKGAHGDLQTVIHSFNQTVFEVTVSQEWRREEGWGRCWNMSDSGRA